VYAYVHACICACVRVFVRVRVWSFVGLCNCGECICEAVVLYVSPNPRPLTIDYWHCFAGEDRYVWGLAVRDKVPMTQRFLTVTTALALLSYVVYELLI